MGDLKVLTRGRVERLYMTDVKTALLALSVPNFQLDWDPSPSSKTALQKFTQSSPPPLAQLGTRLVRKLSQGLLGDNLHHIIGEAV
jgi:hypothetical protein